MRLPVAVCFAMSLICLTLHPTYAYNGQFPGKGNAKVWKKANALYLKGLRAEHKHMADEALHLYQQAIAMYPYDADFYLSLGMLYEDETQDLDTAETMLRKALELAPDDIQINMSWASLLEEQGKLKEATAALSRAHELIRVRKQTGELK